VSMHVAVDFRFQRNYNWQMMFLMSISWFSLSRNPKRPTTLHGYFF